jgi:mercuric ion transport protein
MRSLGKKVLVMTGMLVCPCHMPLVLPLLATALSGTVIGAWLSANMGVVFLATTIYFLSALVVGIRWLARMPTPGNIQTPVATCPPVSPPPATDSRPVAVELASSAHTAERV